MLTNKNIAAVNALLHFSVNYLKYRVLVSRMLLSRECRAPVNETERDAKFSRSDYQKKKALSSLFCS